MCLKAEETNQHLFLNCEVALALWTHIVKALRSSLVGRYTTVRHDIKGIEKWNREVWVVSYLTCLKNFFLFPIRTVIMPCRDTILGSMGHLSPFLLGMRTWEPFFRKQFGSKPPTSPCRSGTLTLSKKLGTLIAHLARSISGPQTPYFLDQSNFSWNRWRLPSSRPSFG
ncbi:hypothetical protein AMTRI_Chr04g179550 [Amborella trichopoda]